jgi:hypothetical protein
MALIEVNGDEIDWCQLSKNPSAMYILLAFPEKISWIGLSENPAAISVLEANVDKVHWGALSKNPNAMHMLKENVDKVDPWNLSTNPNAVPFLMEHPSLLNWSGLSRNPNAIHLLEANMSKIDWKQLSANPNAMHLLKQNQSKLDYGNVSANPGIFAEEESPAMRLRARLNQASDVEVRTMVSKHNLPARPNKTDMIDALVTAMYGSVLPMLKALPCEEFAEVCAGFDIPPSMEQLESYLIEHSIYEIKKKVKHAIPKQVKTLVWHSYIGDDVPYHKCLCCKKVTIHIDDFYVGYVVHGKPSTDNLRPICISCKVNLGNMSMPDFIEMHNYYV